MQVFLKELHELSQQPVNGDEGVPFNVGYFDIYMFDTFIRSIEQKSDHEVTTFLRTNLEYIFDKVLKCEWKYTELFWSEKFYRCMKIILSSIPITGTIRMGYNKIGYDHVLPDIYEKKRKADFDIMNQFYDIALMVNQPYVSQICAKMDIPSYFATDLCVCRFSSIREEVNICRLNFRMCEYVPTRSQMTEQNIIYIYEILFDSVTSLFKYTMFEYNPPDQALDLGNEFGEIFSTISLCILDIVNNMPMEAIRYVIRSFVQDWEYRKCPPTRFSLMSLSADYNRINTVVDELTQERVFVP